MAFTKKAVNATLFFCLTLFGYQNEALASSLVSEINVEGPRVTFKMQAPKAGQLLDCVTDGKEQLWSLTLTDQSSRATYSMLVTAMALNKAVKVLSAGDCGDFEGVERAARIWFEKE